jgi:hypothetical protein
MSNSDGGMLEFYGAVARYGGMSEFWWWLEKDLQPLSLLFEFEMTMIPAPEPVHLTKEM